jgi:hypothetical protein
MRLAFTLPIKSLPISIGRLSLEVGKSEAITAAYICLPQMSVQAVPQRYTALAREKDKGAYRYEGFRDFTAVLSVDKDLLVVDYPETFHRVFP